MSVSVSGAGSPDLVHLLMMRKEMAAEKAQSAQLLEMLPPAQPQPAARPAPSPGTFYL